MRQYSRAFAALLVTSALSSPALAVDPAGTPAVRQNRDSNGVDVALGTFNFSTRAISIGPSAPQGLSYSRTNEGNGWLENVAATISQDSSGNYIVSAGGTSDSFANIGSSFTNNLGDGATLTFNGDVYTYTNRNGAVAYFDVANGTYDRYVANVGWIREVDFPNGIQWTYQYLGQEYCPTDPDPGNPCYLPAARSNRLEAVFTNTGYQLFFAYQSDTLVNQSDLDGWQTLVTVKAINNSTDYCNPVTGSCSITGNWATLLLNRTNTGSGWDEAETDPTGAVTHYYTDYNDRLTGVLRPGGTSNDIAVTYGSDGHVSQLTRAGVTYNYAWADSGNTRTMTRTDPLSHTLTAVSAIDTSLVSSITDENGHTTTYQYDSNYRPTRVTKPEGNYTQYAYDGRGNITQTREVAKSGSGLSDIVANAGFDATCANSLTCNKPNWTQDAAGHQTDYTYDPTQGGLLSITRPVPTSGGIRPQTRISYTGLHAYYKQSATNSPTASTATIYLPSGISACQTTSSCTGTADETKTAIAYGPQVSGTANNLLPVSTSSGAGDGSLTATTSFTYDAFGNQITVDGPLAGAADTSMKRYDADRRVVGEISPDPDGSGSLVPLAIRVTYRPDGQVSKKEFGTVTDQSDAAWANFASAHEVDIGYDSNSRQNTEALKSGSTTYAYVHRDYDILGRVNCTAVRMDSAVYNSLPGACALSTQGSYGPDQISKIIYDAASHVTQVQVGVGTSAAANERTLTYNPNGTVATLLDGMNNLTTYSYDGFDRLGITYFPSPTQGSGTSNSSDNQQFAYDANGNVTAYRNRAGSLFQFSFDGLNRMTQKVVPSFGTIAGYTTNYTYDLLSRSLTATFASSGRGITNTYDALGRMTSSSSNMDGTARTASSQYDLVGNRTLLNVNVGGYSAPASYDLLNRMTANGGLVQIAYDNLGRRSTTNWGSSGTTSSEAYSYDSIDRLTSLTHDLAGTTSDVTLTYGYSPASQITSRASNNDSYAYPGLSDLTRPFTSNGLNQYTATSGITNTYDANGNTTSDGINTYAYDAENHLVSVSGTSPATLTYDPLGRLWQLNASTGPTDFIYDGDHDVVETDGSGNETRAFVWGPGADEPLVSWELGTGPRMLHADERGSIISAADSSGNKLAINSYDEYGRPASTNQGRFQYTGQAYLPEIGLYYYKARMYSPQWGRFLQTDPIGYGDGPNWYAYAHNDPVNGVDPAGLGAPDTPACNNCTARVGGTDTGSSAPAPCSGDCSPIPVTGWGTPQSVVLALNLGISAPPLDFASLDASGANQLQQRASLLRRIYRKFVKDPCAGQGTNEGAGVPAGYTPYDVNEKDSMDQYDRHVIPDHNFDSSAPVLAMIATAIQTEPAKGSGGSLVYTVNTGQYVGFDNRHGAGSDYITVVMGPEIGGKRTLKTAYPGCR